MRFVACGVQESSVSSIQLIVEWCELGGHFVWRHSFSGDRTQKHRSSTFKPQNQHQNCTNVFQMKLKHSVSIRFRSLAMENIIMQVCHNSRLQFVNCRFVGLRSLQGAVVAALRPQNLIQIVFQDVLLLFKSRNWKSMFCEV